MNGDAPASGGPVSAELIADLWPRRAASSSPQGVVDAFGHVSMRQSPGRRSATLNGARPRPHWVTPDDIIEYDLRRQSRATPGAAGRLQLLERFIHGEIYRRDPIFIPSCYKPFRLR